jgi:hypothetical protein
MEYDQAPGGNDSGGLATSFQNNAKKTRDSYIREVWLNFRIGKNRMKRRFVAVLARDVQGGVALGLKPFPQVLGVILTANATVEQARHLSVH